MAIADKGTLGSAAHATNASSYALTTTTTDVAVGDMILVASVADNTSTTDGDNNELTGVTDSAGNTYSKIGENTNSPTGAAGDGVTVSVYLAKATAALTIGGTITLTFASARTEKCVFARALTVSAGATLVSGATPIATETTLAPNFGSATFSGLSSIERFYFRLGGKESNSTVALTATTNFTLMGNTRSSALSTAVTARGEYRITTSTGETSNPSLNVSVDTAAIFVALEEAGGALTFSPGVGSLTLTGQLPTAPIGFTAPVLTPGKASLTLTGQQPVAVVGGDTVITVPTGTLRFKGPAATSPVFIPAPAALALTGRQPSLVYLFLTVPTGTLTLTGRQPQAIVTPSGTFKIPPAVLTLQGQYVGQGFGYLQAGVMTLTGYAPALKFGVGRSPDPAALNLTGQSVNAQVSVVMSPNRAQLSLDGQPPEIVLFGQIRPAPAILTFTGWAPQAAIGAVLSPVIPIPPAALTLTGQIPFLGADRTIAVPTASLVLTGQVPQGIITGAALVIPVGTAVLTLTSAGDPLLKYFWVVSPPPARLRLLGPDPEMAGAQFGVGKMSYPSWQSVINS